MKKLILVALILSTGLLADDFDDADKAYKAGDYQAAAFPKACDGGDVKGCTMLANSDQRRPRRKARLSKSKRAFPKSWRWWGGLWVAIILGFYMTRPWPKAR